MSDIQALERKLESFRGEISDRFDRVHEDLKELTKALRDLIRLDGDIRRLQDAIGRIGRSTDDHEARLRTVEAAAVTSDVQRHHLDRTQWLGITTVASLVATIIAGGALYLMTH